MDPGLTQNDRMRGQVIGTEKSLPKPVSELEVEFSYIKRLVSEVESKINANEPVVLTVGTASLVGIVTSIHKEKARISLKGEAVVLPGQKIALSRKAAGKWQLVAYAVAK